MLRKAGIFLLSCLAMASASVFLKGSLELAREERAFDCVREYMEEREAAGDGELSALEELMERYPDCIGYLEIEGTEISYPIMQNSDNEYYLYRSMDGEASRSGCIYMDSNHDIRRKGLHSIYGHHMKNGTMFKDISRFTDSGYLEEHQEIRIQTAGQSIRLRPVCCCVGEEDGSYRSRLTSPAQISDFIETHTGRRLAADDLYVLITCSYEREGERIYLYCVPWMYAS